MITRIRKVVTLLFVALVLVQCRDQYDYTDRLNKVNGLDKQAYNYENPYHDFMVLNDEASKQIIPPLPVPKVHDDARIKERVCVAICVRNCGRFLENSLSRLESICSCFQQSSIVFYENGSSDNSRKKLESYCKANKNAILIKEDYDISQYPRTVRLARGRNLCLDICKKMKPEYTVVLDLDDVIQGLEVESFLTAFDQPYEWDALFGNQKGTYYDLWALRTYDCWMQYDLWEAITWIPWEEVFVPSCFRNVPKEAVIPVISAFGGLAIYKQASLENCFYYGHKNYRECCEHVHLHKQMVNKRKKLFILGSLINH